MIDLRCGDCIDVLAELGDDSIDAIVTDPPYGLTFMGKAWDKSVPSEAVWRECLRVLKPGGHLLSFAGTRTQHRMAVNIEDAGFEIRDMIAWVYGSGFPKSLDVSKAIDKRGGSVAGFTDFRDAVRDAMRRNGVTRSELQAALGNYMLSHYLTDASQPAVPNLRDYRIIRDTVGLGGAFDELFKDEAEREAVGKQQGTHPVNHINASNFSQGAQGRRQLDITAPATPEAQQWDGWGTALKPALEPITLARKPFKSTVAANVLAHGTGALNVDGCRVGTEARTFKGMSSKQPDGAGTFRDDNWQPRDVTTVAIGRWPANLIHDGSDEVTRLFPETNDTSAARYFYCAKASKRDRDEGCEGLDAKRTTFADGTGLKNNGDGTPRNQEPSNRNNHPTVKPTELMRYLCRLVTPPGGVVLDPFMGSGSTGKAALLEGFDFIGIELDPEYLEIARARIETNKDLFAA